MEDALILLLFYFLGCFIGNKSENLEVLVAKRISKMSCSNYNEGENKIADRVGSIEIGKDADFIVVDKLPYEFDMNVLMTFIDGKKLK